MKTHYDMIAYNIKNVSTLYLSDVVVILVQ